MIEHTACPVCGGKKLKLIGQRCIRIIDDKPSRAVLKDNQLLITVLKKDQQTTKTVYCIACTHIFLNPTFDDEEITRLYSGEYGASTGSIDNTTGSSRTLERGISDQLKQKLLDESRLYRARRLFYLVNAVTNGQAAVTGSICDIGANTGELTSGFSASRRYVYDKDFSGLKDPNVIVLKTMEELKAAGPFDLTVLSHILEHVPFPVKFLQELKSSVGGKGLMYVEVPVEYSIPYVRKQAIALGPHVNYFTPESVVTCIRNAGYTEGISFRRELVPYYWNRKVAYKVFARPGAASPAVTVSRMRFWMHVVTDIAYMAGLKYFGKQMMFR